MEDADGVEEARRLADESEGGSRKVKTGWTRFLVPAVALGWSCFQLYAATVVINSILVRYAHLAFAMTLTFLCYPMFKKTKKSKFWSNISTTGTATRSPILLSRCLPQACRCTR